MSGGESRSPGQAVAVALGRVMGGLARHFEEVMAREGLTHTQYNVLRILRGAPEAGLARGTIVERLLVPNPDVTRLVDRLVERGLVRRERGAADRRIVHHALTDEGAGVLSAVDAELAHVHAGIEEALDPDARAGLLTALARIQDALDRGAIAAPPIPD